MDGGTNVGVVGVGRMGAAMARRLRDRGVRVAVVLDRDAAAAEALAAEIGAVATRRLAEVTERADVVLTVVSDDDAMRGLYDPAAEDSLLVGAAGRRFVDCATVTPAVHGTVAAATRAVGARTVEACMAGSITQAREGSLTLLCGGDPADVEAVRALLERLGSVRYVGETGRAAQLKALVNMVMNVNTAALAEGLGLAARLGLDLGVVREVFAQTGAQSRVLVTDGDDMVAREHEVYFSAAHAAKDSGIALDLARERGASTPLAAATKEQYDRLVALGYGELDKSAIAELTFPGRGQART